MRFIVLGLVGMILGIMFGPFGFVAGGMAGLMLGLYTAEEL